MADFGSVAKELDSFLDGGWGRIPSLFHTPGGGTDSVKNVGGADTTFVPMNGHLYVSALEAGSPVANCVVILLRRRDGKRIGYALTDADGDCAFYFLDPASNDYTVLVLDPDGGTQYVDGCLSRLTPAT